MVVNGFCHSYLVTQVKSKLVHAGIHKATDCKLILLSITCLAVSLAK